MPSSFISLAQELSCSCSLKSIASSTSFLCNMSLSSFIISSITAMSPGAFRQHSSCLESSSLFTSLLEQLYLAYLQDFGMFEMYNSVIKHLSGVGSNFTPHIGHLLDVLTISGKHLLHKM